MRERGPILVITVLLRAKDIRFHTIQYGDYATEVDNTNTVYVKLSLSALMCVWGNDVISYKAGCSLACTFSGIVNAAFLGIYCLST
jgi:hypothetical protein